MAGLVFRAIEDDHAAIFSLEGSRETFTLEGMRVFVCLLFLIACFTAAAEVSITPPKWYHEVLESQLTPLEQLNLEPGEALIEDEPGVILLSELIYRVRPNGAKDALYHYVYRPLTEKGVEQVQEERISFSSKRQKVHLLRARTITPDGKTIEAAKDGIFLQRPEGDRSSSIYDDSEDLVVIYSDVKVGCLVEIIVLREEMEPRVKGETSGVTSWGSGGWPAALRRRVVGVGPEMNKRFQVVPLGKGNPTAQISQVKDLTWYDWSDRNSVARSYETNRPPYRQSGPSVWYTTFKSWEEVGRWYGRLVGPQGLMESSLRSEVEKAVGGLTKPREILDALYPLAAKEVRYTGLEFGHSGILPYSCNEVWDRKYGDCKDKSTLLVSMLRSRGIKAWVGLVNTENEGLIPKEAPGTRMFNHVIVIVDVDPGEKEELVFCDPTISYGAPGVISPSSADRDVLLASSDGGRLVRSPRALAGSYHYDFDLELDEAGRMSGWLTWKSSGYYAVSTASSYDGLDRDSMSSRLARVVTNFFPSAEVVDFEVPDKLAPGISECVIKVFFTTAPGDHPADANIPVTFPKSDTLFMDYGNEKTRESDFFQWQDLITVSMSLKLAEGLVPVVLHPPLHALSPGYHIDAGWDFKPKELKTLLKVQCLKPSLEPTEVLAARQASRAWSRWSDQPLLLKAGKDWKAPAEGSEIKLPLMPSGRGQLALVQRWYPLSQESKRRKLALEKVLQLFPNDPETLYDTRLSLAYIDYYADRLREARAAYRKLAAKLPKGVTVASHSLAVYMEGLCEYELKRFKEAAVLFEKSATIEEVSDFRKGWGLTGQGQSLMRAGQLDQALATFLRAEKVEGNHRGELVHDLIHCFLKNDQPGEAVAAWERFKAASVDEAMNTLKSLAKDPADPLLASNDQLKIFFEVVRPKLNPDEASTLDLWVGDFTYQREKLKKAGELRSKTLAVLKEKFPGYLRKDLYENFADPKSYQEKLTELYGTDSDKWLEYCYGYLARFEVDEYFTTFFWHFIIHVEWKENSLPKAQQVLMRSLIPLCEIIPRQDDNYWECQFIVAEWYEEQEEWKKAANVFEVMINDPAFDEGFAGTAWLRRGIALEHLGKWEEAVKVHLHLKGEKMESALACQQLLRAGWILARLGKADEALETWSLLREVPASLYESLDDSDLIGEAALLAGMPDKTKSYWKRTGQWWKETLMGYLDENDLEIPSAPLLSDHLREVVIATHLGQEVGDIDLEELSEIVTVILSGARWFPSFTGRTQDLFESFVRPITRAKNEDFRRVAMTLLDTVNAGSEEVQIVAAGQGLFYKVVLSEKDTLEHGYQLLKRLDREVYDGARETALRRMSFAAMRDQKDLEKVEGLLRDDWELRGRDQGRFNIGVAIAKVLKSRGLAGEAIDFTREVLKVPGIRENPESLEAVERYLESLEGESNEMQAFVAQIDALHKMDPVPWLSHVSPNDLEEERFEDPAEYLGGSGEPRHGLENYKWGYLLLKSDLITKEQRMEVFEKLLDFHLGRCLKNRDYNAMVDQVLANERIPEVMRRTMMWKSAVDASFVQIDEERVRELSGHPLSEGLTDTLKEQGFQDLLAVARVKKGSADEQVAQIKALVARGELNAVSVGCLENITAATRILMDDKATAEIVNLYKTFKFPEKSSREMRQMAIRYRKSSAEIAEFYQFVPILKSAFKTRLSELAEHAPPDWADYRDYGLDLNLDRSIGAGVYAKLILEGIPQKMVHNVPWRMIIPHLVVRDGETLDDEALKLLLTSLEQLESTEAVTFILAPLFSLTDLADELRLNCLRQCRPWIESRKDRNLEDSLTVAEFVSDGSSVAEDELLRLARKFTRLEEPGDFLTCLKILEMTMDRPKQEPLRAVLEGLPEDVLFEVPVAIVATQGFQQLGEDDEVELFEEVILECMSDDWKSAWGGRNVYAYQSAVSSYWLVARKDGASVPVWMREIPKTMPLKSNRVRCELLLLMTQGKWREFEDLLKKNLKILEGAEGRVLIACADIGLKKKGALEKGRKVLRSPDKRDSYAIQLREMLKE